MKFREWLQLQEVGTGTNAIAVFSRPAIGMVQREPIDMIGVDKDKDEKKKKKHKKHDDLDHK